jgi:hypothetical protein
MPAQGFTAPRRLEDWRDVDLDHSIGPWISSRVRRWVPRYNFYLRHGYQKPARGLGRGQLHHAARARAKADFYRFDLERRAADLIRLLRTGIDRQQPRIAED